MNTVLSYPLTPIPLCFSHLDGTINATPKSTLLNSLEKRNISSDPSKVDVKIIDGFFLLHLFVDLPTTFGKIARYILNKLCGTNCKRVDLVFDQIVTPSIKDIERDRRSDGDRDVPFIITGPNQLRPNDFLKALRNDNFKIEFIKFLVDSFDDDSLCNIIGDKTVRVTKGSSCYVFTATDGRVLKEIDERLCSTHEEADSKMIAHLTSIPSPANVVLRTADTDVFIVALGNIHKIKSGVNVFIELGLASKNTIRFVDLTSLSKRLGPKLCKSLPGFHALTGCDYTPSFAYKGKMRPLSMLEKNGDAQTAFGKLGSMEMLSEATIKSIEKFVCEMYGTKGAESVNESRFALFMKVYSPKGKHPMASVKGIDGSLLPPCRSVLIEQIKRSNAICSFWNSATVLKPTVFPPEKNV